MFKPTNPKFDMLIASLKEDRDKKHNIDNEISELPFIFSEVDDLEKEIEEMECDITFILIDEKHSELNVDVFISPQFYGWIFGLGKDVKVVGPEEVVEEMKQKAEEFLKNLNE